MIDVRWVWAFLDTPREHAPRSWDFWAQVTRSRLSPRRGEDGEFATLLPEEADPWVKVQAVVDGGGVHLDLDVPDPRAAAGVATGLGAVEVATIDTSVVVMRTPAGQLFCLTTADGAPTQVREGEPDLLDQVCLDLPESAYAAEVAFWSALTGWPAAAGSSGQFTALTRPHGIPVRFLLQRLDAPDGPVRAHVDLACRDRAATRAEHERLGARVLAEHPWWSVLTDPVGRTYCLTDRDPLTSMLTSTLGSTRPQT